MEIPTSVAWYFDALARHAVETLESLFLGFSAVGAPASSAN